MGALLSVPTHMCAAGVQFVLHAMSLSQPPSLPGPQTLYMCRIHGWSFKTDEHLSLTSWVSLLQQLMLADIHKAEAGPFMVPGGMQSHQQQHQQGGFGGAPTTPVSARQTPGITTVVFVRLRIDSKVHFVVVYH